MRRPPAAVSLIFALIFLTAFAWFGVALLIASGSHPGMPSDVTVRAVMAGLCTAGGAASLGLYALLRKRSAFGYWAALVYFALGVLVSLFDDFGAADAVFMALNALILILLIACRRWFLRRSAVKKKT